MRGMWFIQLALLHYYLPVSCYCFCETKLEAPPGLWALETQIHNSKTGKGEGWMVHLLVG